MDPVHSKISSIVIYMIITYMEYCIPLCTLKSFTQLLLPKHYRQAKQTNQLTKQKPLNIHFLLSASKILKTKYSIIKDIAEFDINPNYYIKMKQ